MKHDRWLILVVIGYVVLIFILPWYGWLILILLFIGYMECADEIKKRSQEIEVEKSKEILNQLSSLSYLFENNNQ